MKPIYSLIAVVGMLTAFHPTNHLHAQGFGRGPQVTSPEVKDGQITFRILAPNAKQVRLSAGDIPNVGQGADMTKNDDGVWETTLDVAPGYYRYNFNVDGVSVIDPRNP